MASELLVSFGAKAPDSAGLVRVARSLPGVTSVRVAELDHGCIVLADRGGSLGSAELSREIPTACVSPTPAALARYQTARDHAALGEEGAHAAVRVEGSSIRLQTDGVGRMPLYEAHDAEHLVASTSLGALVGLGVPLQWDQLGVAEYLANLHCFGTRTLLSGVRVLPAGADWVWSPGTMSDPPGRPLMRPDSSPLSDQEVADQFALAWSESLSIIAGDVPGRPLGLGLSGGMDSRVIGEELVRQREAPLAITYGDEGNLEVVVARRVARRLGIPHLLLPVSQGVAGADWAADALLLDGAHSPAESYDLWFAEHWQRHCAAQLNGAWGGPVWGDHKTLGVSDPRVVAADIVGRSALTRVAPLVGENPLPDVRQAMEDDAAESLAGWDAGPEIGVFWGVDNRQRHWGLAPSRAADRIGLPWFGPYLNGGVLAVLRRMSMEQRRNGRLYLEMQRANFPATSGIPRRDDGNAPANLSHIYYAGDESLARQLARLGRSHPASLSRRVARESRHRLATRVAPKGALSAWGRRVDTSEDLFGHWSLSVRRQYRAKALAYLERGMNDLPPGVSIEPLDRMARELRAGEEVSAAIPLAMRAATLGIWNQQWRGYAEGT